MIGHALWIVFDIPNGIVIGNLLASVLWVPIALLGLYVFRNHIGRKLIAWLHKHHADHLARIASEALDLPEGPGDGNPSKV